MADFRLDSIGPMVGSNQRKANAKAAPSPDKVSFGQWLHQSLGKVNQMQQQAGESALKLTTGENKDIHGTMITMQKADIATNLMIEVRNKLLSAYDEIKRMQF